MQSSIAGWRPLLAAVLAHAVATATFLFLMSVVVFAQTAILNVSCEPPFSLQGQEIVVRHAFLPRDERVLETLANRFPAIKTFSVERVPGSWAEVQRKHFADGGIYDRIVIKR
jgi:hypothetical protein